MAHSYYRPNPGVGDVISQSFALLRRRPGRYFGLGAVAAAVTLLSTITMLAIAAAGWSPFMMAAVRQDLGRIGELLLAWFGIVVVSSLVAGAVGLLISSLLTRLSAAELSDQRPSLPDLIGTLGEFARRMLPLAALGVVAYLVVMGVAFLPMLLAMGTLADPYPDTDVIAGGVGVSMLLLLPIGLLVVFVAVRLLYIVQVVSLEGLGWTTALGRAWSLTAGVFWRTFGTLLVVYLIVYAVTMVVNMGSQVFLVGAIENLESLNPLSPAFFEQIVATMVVPLAAQSLLQVLTIPFLQAAITVMYLNRTRELALAPAYPPAPYGYPPAPQAYPPAPQGYPPAPQAYPQAPYGYPPSPTGPVPHPQGYGSPPAPAYPPQYGSGWAPQGPIPGGQSPQGYPPAPPAPPAWHPPGTDQPPHPQAPPPGQPGQQPPAPGQPPYRRD